MRISVEKALIRQIAVLVYNYMMQTRDMDIARIFMVEDRFDSPKRITQDFGGTK